jgi:hypothetical protein
LQILQTQPSPAVTSRESLPSTVENNNKTTKKTPESDKESDDSDSGTDSNPDSSEESQYKSAKKKSKGKRKNPKDKRDSATIVKDMNKCMNHATFPKLEYFAAIDKRQRSFQTYIRALQNVLMNIKELRKVLNHFPLIGACPTKRSARALYSFIQSTVDKGYYEYLESFMREEQEQDGSKALHYLRTICLSQSPQLQQKAKNDYDNLRIAEGQKLITFNRFFNAAYSLYTARGGELTTHTRITNYFDATTMVDDPQMNGITLHL